MISSAGVDALVRRRPEWSPWLAVVDEVLRESLTSRWDAAVPAPSLDEGRSRPRLSGTTVLLDSTMVQRFLHHLVETASRGESPKMATLRRVRPADLDVAALFEASICHRDGPVAGVAASTGADAEALQAIVALLPVPFLQACNRQWAASLPADWSEGYCPVCGAWPSLAEVRGIERSRHLRCGRCGGSWHAHILHCAFCATRNHDELATLVPEKTGAAGVIEACRRCHGYVKAFNRLQACPPASVMIEDLGSVDLDVAALAQGHTRPAGHGYPLQITVRPAAVPRRFFAWNA